MVSRTGLVEGIHRPLLKRPTLVRLLAVTAAGLGVWLATRERGERTRPSAVPSTEPENSMTISLTVLGDENEQTRFRATETGRQPHRHPSGCGEVARSESARQRTRKCARRRQPGTVRD